MSSATETTSIICRDILDLEEIRAVEDLQIEAWGDDPRDIVPLNQLVAARYVGGSLIGAFDHDALIGFVYGFYGHVHGRIVHHSHMLAVLPAYRSHDLGFRLKAAQREQVLADGIADRITWTFDPLQSLNAYFNFAKLGVLSDTYKVNVYGEEATSFLHRNGTDRLFATWPLQSPRVHAFLSGNRPGRSERTPPERPISWLLRCDAAGRPEPLAASGTGTAKGLAAIEIPADINHVERTNIELAREWRLETRRAFSAALDSGYVVVDYFLASKNSGYYLLEKSPFEEAASR